MAIKKRSFMCPMLINYIMTHKNCSFGKLRDIRFIMAHSTVLACVCSWYKKGLYLWLFIFQALGTNIILVLFFFNQTQRGRENIQNEIYNNINQYIHYMSLYKLSSRWFLSCTMIKYSFVKSEFISPISDSMISLDYYKEIDI